jgi:hypothetical protein
MVLDKDTLHMKVVELDEIYIFLVLRYLNLKLFRFFLKKLIQNMINMLLKIYIIFWAS